MSNLSASSQNTLLAGIDSSLDLIPNDADSMFTRFDSATFQAHVSPSIDIAYNLASMIVSNAVFIDTMTQVCGTGSTKASLANITCLQTFIKTYGQRAFRRPLVAAEITDFVNSYNSQVGDDKIVLVISRMLSSPRFFYKLDNEGTKIAGNDGVDAIYQLSKYELLSKITFLFWSAPPDDNLINMVTNLDLNQSAALNQVIDSVASNQKAKTGILNFYSEWLKLGEVPALTSTDKAFVALAEGQNVNIRNDLVQEVLDMLEFYSFTTNGRYEDLMTSPYSFAKTSSLAQIYSTPVWNGSSSSLQRFPASDNRAGLLGRAAFLVANSAYTRPVQKGKRIRFHLLCDDVPPPTMVTDFKVLVQNTGISTRQAFESATEGSSCISCHKEMNPLGFTSENFDSLGRARKAELKFNIDGTIANSVNVDTSTIANIFPGDDTPINGLVEMQTHIASTGKGQKCMVQQFFRYSQFRHENELQDGCEMESMRQELVSGGGSLLKMFKASAKVSSFAKRRVK
ncbi:MAG: hypothetical protein A4S09_14270 [Proteobacteria bacterium SG_bin7]|nr:MAG: hypothetical protein A4S09_14270 [Proteobacteria bacterium SG_bin7]